MLITIELAFARPKRLFLADLTFLHIVELVGLIARAYSSSHLSEQAPFIVQTLAILLAPIVFAAAVYMFLGRLIRASGHPKLSFIRINWLTKIFVSGDVVCFLIQAAGAGQLVSADNGDQIASAQNIILAGLGLQVFFSAIFALCAVLFHIRVSRGPYPKAVDPSLRLNAMLTSIYICSILITIRNIYRLIEYQGGEDSYLQTHEWPTYGLDVFLMAIIMIIMLFWYDVGTARGRPDAYAMAAQEESV